MGATVLAMMIGPPEVCHEMQDDNGLQVAFGLRMAAMHACVFGHQSVVSKQNEELFCAA